ncbi:MAG: hypothetical protein GEV10_17445 [Streptosporangiales bacterium]|nr:hypothetical protein [Streptosporangiales bacterium]
MRLWHGGATGGSAAVPRWILLVIVLAGFLAMHALGGPGDRHLGMPGMAASSSASGSVHHMAPTVSPGGYESRLSSSRSPGDIDLMPACLAILLGALLLGVRRGSPLRTTRTTGHLSVRVDIRVAGLSSPRSLSLHQLCVLRT